MKEKLRKMRAWPQPKQTQAWQEDQVSGQLLMVLKGNRAQALDSLGHAVTASQLHRIIGEAEVHVENPK